MKFKINTHSVIDLITNSSTEMFMNMENSVEPLKLINEFFKVSRVDKTCDDVFKLTIANEYWEDWFEDMKDDYPELTEEQVKAKAMEPDGENKTELIIETLDPEYEHLGKLIKNLMESPKLDEYMC